MNVYSVPGYPTISRGNKYGAKKAYMANGEKFDSEKEMNRYIDLCMLQKAGEISDLKRQVRFEIIPANKKSDGKTERKCEYVADFVYTTKDGKKTVEDVKGYRGGGAYAVFVIKRKLMLDRYGIEIKEV